MSTDAYNQALLDLADSPQPPPSAPTHQATARNRFCADRVTLSLRVQGDRIVQAGWEGEACVICRAAATTLCRHLVHHPLSALPSASEDMRSALSGHQSGHVPTGPFAPFSTLAELPARRACALLPFEAAQLALSGDAQQAPSPAQPSSSPQDPWALAMHWRAQGQAVAIATLVDVVGSSPCPIGSLMVVAQDGRFQGAVSGGCVESAVVQACIELLERGDGPALRAFQISNSQAGEIGLPCGGRVEIHIGPAPGDRLLRQYQARGQGLARVLDLETGHETLEDSERLHPGKHAGRFLQPLTRPPRLLILGGTEIAQKLVELAANLDFECRVIEPRPGFAHAGRFSVPVDPRPPEQALPAWIDADTAVVMLTHDPRLDDPGLQLALPSPAFFVGALGSRKTQRRRLERLSAAGVAPQHLARLRGPVGLPIGAQGSAEIALSILAEVVATRRQAAPKGVACIVLAAGSSRRAGPVNKLLQDLDGEPLIRRSVRTCISAALGPVLVVLGHQSEQVRAALSGLPVQFVDNPQHAEGMASSIRAGVQALAAHSVSGAFVVLGDMPFLRQEELLTLAQAHTPSTQHLVVVPVAGAGSSRRRGNPVLWPARCFDQLLALRGDVGGKAILQASPGAVLEVPVEDGGVLRDVDGVLAGDSARKPG